MEFVVAVVGDRGTGKSCWVSRITTGKYSRLHTPTTEVDRIPTRWHTSAGVLDMTLLDCPPSEVPSANAYVHLACHTVSNLVGITPPGITALCISKLNMHDGVSAEVEQIPGFLGTFSVSSRSNSNLDLPMLSILRLLTGIADLVFVEAPAMTPPTISIWAEAP